MKKIYNYVMINISLTKLPIILAITYIYQFSLFFELITRNTKYNFFDVLLNNFNSISLFNIISLFFLVMLYNIFGKNNFLKYITLKLSSKVQVYNSNIFTIFLLSIFMVFFINIVSILECLNNISFKNVWSEHFFNTMTGDLNLFYDTNIIELLTNKITPFEYISYTNILVILYLFFLGILFYNINIIIKKRNVSLFLIIIINVISILLDSVPGIIGRLTFTQNIFFVTANIKDFYNYSFISWRLLYWILLILSVYIFGIYSTKKIDYNFED